MLHIYTIHLQWLLKQYYKRWMKLYISSKSCIKWIFIYDLKLFWIHFIFYTQFAFMSLCKCRYNVYLFGSSMFVFIWLATTFCNLLSTSINIYLSVESTDFTNTWSVFTGCPVLLEDTISFTSVCNIVIFFLYDNRFIFVLTSEDSTIRPKLVA